MESLGKKERMYPSMADDNKEKVRYPSTKLPLSLLGDKKLNVGDEVTLKVKGKVKRISQDEYEEGFTIELRQGEIVSDTPKK